MVVIHSIRLSECNNKTAIMQLYEGCKERGVVRDNKLVVDSKICMRLISDKAPNDFHIAIACRDYCSKYSHIMIINDV